jgi:short-subunit dehydrogenase
MGRFRERYGPWALVTGASSGIGAAFVRLLAESGLNVALAARRADRLRELAAALEKNHAIETRVVPVDLAGRNFLPPFLAALDGIEIGLLVNNAGFGNLGPFLENDLDREVNALHVNCRASSSSPPTSPSRRSPSWRTTPPRRPTISSWARRSRRSCGEAAWT